MNIEKQIAALDGMTVGELQDRYVKVFGEPVRSRHMKYLVRRIAWRIQANAEGGLSERALRRAEELANDADVRVTAPREAVASKPAAGVRVALAAAETRQAVTDRRLPPPGAQITRRYKGRTIAVTVRGDGFEYLGEHYRSLTAVAKVITGAHMNGFRFFGLEAKS